MNRDEVQKKLYAMISLIGEEVFRECIAEYLRGSTKPDCKLKMDFDETKEFIENVGRCELFDELEQMEKIREMKLTAFQWPYPRYLKAVRVSLVALGYDEKWVDTEFRGMLEKRYMGR